MPRTRVLVVDDAVVVRRIVTDALGSDPGLEIVGTAPNGRIALCKIPQVNPDIVTLDVEMPEMDGIETLEAIRRTYPRLPVIMFSTLTERGASVTMEALLRGANDYVTKPSNVDSLSEATQRIRDQLVPKIHAHCATSLPAPRPAPDTPLGRPQTTGQGPFAPVRAVVVGVSTGGPNALAEFLPALPRDLGVPVLVVQHMPTMFTKLLAERLNSLCQLAVGEAAHGERVTPERILIAPGDRHLEVHRRGERVEVALTDAPPENSCRPSADVLFRTAVEVWGAGTLGVVMTGMGGDARRGSEEIHGAGGRVIVQDQATSVVWGMPGAVVQAACSDGAYPLGRLAEELSSRVRDVRPVGARPPEVPV